MSVRDVRLTLAYHKIGLLTEALRTRQRYAAERADSDGLFRHQWKAEADHCAKLAAEIEAQRGVSE
jgi:hypothetical protein